MGAAKHKKLVSFSQELIQSWEQDDCVNFSIALSRITGWLLHIDWLQKTSDIDDKKSENDMIPLRVYVANDADSVFDVRGIKTIRRFNEDIILRLIKEREYNQVGGVRTRYYSESSFDFLPLRAKPNETKILEALRVIKENDVFLSLIPPRQEPIIPAYEAANFTFGHCACYAEALRDITNLPAVALLSVRFSPMFGGTHPSKNGYVHSAVLHPDGSVEDAWGRQSVEYVAKRFGIEEYQLDFSEHSRIATDLKRNSPEKFAESYQKAKKLIETYRKT